MKEDRKSKGEGSGERSRKLTTVLLLLLLLQPGTACVIASLLAWVGEVDSPLEGLDRVGRARVPPVPGAKLTIPTQVRYLEYVRSVLAGERLNAGSESKRLALQRVIVNTVPNFEGRVAPRRAEGEGDGAGAGAGAGASKGKDGEQRAGDANGGGCRPFLECLKDGKVVFSTRCRLAAPAAAAAGDDGKGKRGWALPPHYGPGDGCFSFSFGEAAAGAAASAAAAAGAAADGGSDGAAAAKAQSKLMHGDLLFRCRHVRKQGYVVCSALCSCASHTHHNVIQPT